MAETTLLEHSFNTAINHNILDVGTPLSIGKKRWGTLRFAISLRKAEEEIMSTITKIVLLTFIFLIIGFVIILLLSRRFIRPITQLANTMEQARGDYLDIKVDVKGRDELALLGEKFNTMIERIKKANEELRNAHEKLVQSEKLASVGILAAGVAHEINNPLGGLFNCVHMLEYRGEEKEFRREYLNLIKEGLEKIENTVGKLLWVSRTEKDKVSLTNVEDVIKNVASLVEYRLKKSNITLRIIKESDTNLIMIESTDFQQVMLNLFINAIHAMPSGGELIVKTSTVDAKVVIEVRDTGHGIQEENLGKIFDPFFTTKAPGEGTGLGLWMSYEIIREYNGEIDVKSRVGEGSTFTLSFPAYS
ncbi:MAG: ATP-binding protein, partial [Nitrospirota bacterium]